MFFLRFILFLFFSSIGGKIVRPNFFISSNGVEDVDLLRPISEEHGDPTWVLDLSDLDNVSLKKADKEEQSVFDEYVGAPGSSRGAKPLRFNTDQKTLEELKQQLYYHINKFLFADYDEQGNSAPASEEVFSHLTIFYTADATSVAVISNKKQRHYVMRSRLLPDWVYSETLEKEHEVIPEDKMAELFEAVIRILKMFNSFPL